MTVLFLMFLTPFINETHFGFALLMQNIFETEEQNLI